MPITIKTGAMKYKKPNGEYDGFNAIAQESTDQQIASIQTAGAAQVNAVQTTGAAQVSAVQQKGAETLDSIPDDYTELAGDVSSLKSAIDPLRINIADPTSTPLNIYPSGTQWSAADFVYSLPVKVKPNTEYTVMQDGTASVSFRVSMGDNYPALNGACTILGGNDNSNPKHITTGANTQWLLVGYNNTRQSETYSPNTIMVAEGYVTEFIGRDKIQIPANSLSNDAMARITNDVLASVSRSGVIISEEYANNADVVISAESAATVVVSENENMLVLDYYETSPGTSKVTNGITYTVNSDGSITANGTATANADFLVRNSSAPQIPISHDYPVWFSFIDEPTTGIFAYSNGTSVADHGFGEIVNAASITSSLNLTTIFIRITAGTTVSNKVFYPMLSYGAVRKDFVPVKHGTVFSGVTAATFRGTDVKRVITATNTVTVTGALTNKRLSEIKKNKAIKYANMKKFRDAGIMSGAHRGLLTEAPENTIYAFRAAVNANIDYLESDIQITSDGVPVMFHDPTIDRVVTGHTGAISDYTWDQVKEFDVYTYFQTQYPDKWKSEFENARIMSLEEFLQFATGVKKPSILEIKSIPANNQTTLKQGVETVLDLIKKYNYQDSVIWSGSNTTYVHLYRVLTAFPESVVAYCPDSVELTEQRIRFALTYDTETDVCMISSNMITDSAMELCQSLDIPVMTYTVDTLEDALALNPYVKIAMCNSVNPVTLLNDYYMGT